MGSVCYPSNRMEEDGKLYPFLIHQHFQDLGVRSANENKIMDIQRL